MAPTLLQKVLFVLAFARASFALVDTCDCTWTCPPGFTSSYQWRYPLCNGNTIPDFLAESILFSPTPAGEQFIISTCAHGSNCVGALYGLSATGSIQSCTLSGMGAYPNCVDGNAGLGGATVFFRIGFTLVSDGRGCPGCLGSVCVPPATTNGFFAVASFQNVGAIPWKFNPLCPGYCMTIDGCNPEVETIPILLS